MAANPNLVQQFIQIMIQQYKVEIKFKSGVLEDDLKGYKKGEINSFFKAIVSRFKHNANPHEINPDWLLHDGLLGATKIRMLDVGIRIVYRIANEFPDRSVAVIYAIGPRKDKEAYRIAESRKDW
jgi:hypothetical protein